MSTESIKEILMRRDKMTADEADDLIQETKDELRECATNDGSYDEACEIIACNLGLEPDYMYELLFEPK